MNTSPYHLFPIVSYSFLESVTLSLDVLLLWEQEVACSNHAAPTMNGSLLTVRGSPFAVGRYRSPIERICQCSAYGVFCYLCAVNGSHWSNSSKLRQTPRTRDNRELGTANGEPFSVAKPSDLGIFGVPRKIGP
jgi:hypothetical protein